MRSNQDDLISSTRFFISLFSFSLTVGIVVEQSFPYCFFHLVRNRTHHFHIHYQHLLHKRYPRHPHHHFMNFHSYSSYSVVSIVVAVSYKLKECNLNNFVILCTSSDLVITRICLLPPSQTSHSHFCVCQKQRLLGICRNLQYTHHTFASSSSTWIYLSKRSREDLID